MDTRVWPRCERYDSGTQPCVCWFSDEQQKWWLHSGKWPGGEVKMFADYMEMQRRHPCRQPFDWSVI